MNVRRCSGDRTAGAEPVVRVFWAPVLPEHVVVPLAAAEDVHRVSRRHSRADRERSLTAAVLLRLAVSSVFAIPVGDVRAQRSCAACGSRMHGRPSFTPCTVSLLGGADVSVSLSHAGERVAVALGTTCRVGVDVERAGRFVRPDLADLVLDPAQRSSAAAMPDQAVGALVDRTWARKEALLKAVQVGARVRPSTLELEGDHLRSWPRELDPLLSRPSRVRFLEFDAGMGYVASIATVTACREPPLVRITPASRWF